MVSPALRSRPLGEQAQAFQSNTLIAADNSGQLKLSNTLGLNLHVVNPVAGRWTLIIDFAPTVSGTALFEPYTVNLNQTAPAVSATGVPDGNTINADHPAVVRIKVTNTGTAPEAYFVDGRTDAQTTYNLTALTSPNSVAPLTFADNFPEYLVPSQTTSITGLATTSGKEPIEFDMGSPAGDPDIASSQGITVGATLSEPSLTPGVWTILPSVVGPFGRKGATPEATTTAMLATTEAFDPAVTSFTGDLWQASLGGPISVSPVIVQPGKSATIPVTVAPTGKAGTTVSGVFYLDDDSLILFGGKVPNANTVAAIPYSYVIRK